MTNDIVEKFTPFYGGVFSQWYACDLLINGIAYNCAEQYMMAKKALLFGYGRVIQQVVLAHAG